MKRQRLLFSLLVVSLAALSSSLWLKLQKERMIVEDVLAQHVIAASPNVVPLIEDRPPLASPPATNETSACPSVAAPVEMPTEEFVARMEALLTQIPESVTNTLREPELLKDPEYRTARLTQLRISEAKDNPGLAETLALTEAEARSLFELTASRQLELMLENSSPGGGTSFDSMINAVQKVGIAHEQSVRALLGNEKYPKLLEYRANVRPAYLQAARIDKVLAAAGQPLVDSQSRSLKAALLEEQRRPRQPLAVDNSRPVSIISISKARKADNDRRLLEAAGAHLSAAQLEILRRSIDSQSSVNP